jgi:putative SOS response-associated peptidase YedK
MCNLYEYELQEWEIAHLIEHYKLLGMNWTEAMKVYPNRPGRSWSTALAARVVAMLWGLTTGKGTWLTNFRNPHLKTWKPLIDKKAQRCVVPATRFGEPDRNTSKPVQCRWFARPNRKPFMFAGVWTRWSGNRGTRKVPNVGEHLLYSFMTTDPTPSSRPSTTRQCR